MTIAHLKHPHIVRVLDYDVEEDTPFLVMDYAVGGNLRHRHPKGTRLPLETIISYVKQVADALQYAHGQRVIHRDVKPENMLVGEHHELLLSDFGIAIAAQSSRYQHTQQMGGTMAYIAPEQIQGHPRPASDQYSLGIVVYEWFSGNCPFHGSMTEIVAQHLAASPPSLQEKVPTIASEVEQVVLTALEKDPYKRFRSIKAFATALEQAYQNTQASPELPGDQILQTERSVAEMAPSPGQPVLQTPLQSLSLTPSPPETPSGSPAIQSFPSLPPTIPAQSLPLPYAQRTRWNTERKAPENLGNEQLPTLVPSSSRTRGLAVPPRKKLILAVSIVMASALLIALLSNWIVNRELLRTPTPIPTVTPVPAGIITEFPISTPAGFAGGITAGPDGNLWFTESSGIGRITSGR